MKSILDTVTPCIVGAVEVESSPVGINIHRSTAHTRACIADIRFDHASGTPSGVRIEATTDATWIELDLSLTRAIMPEQTVPASFVDIIVDGVLGTPVPITSESIARVSLLDGSMAVEGKDSDTLRFSIGPTASLRQIEIWLTNAARTVISDVRVPAEATFGPAPRSGPVWVHYGSSVSQCAEVQRPTQTWPSIVARTAGRSLINLGLGGQCHLDQGLARSIRELDADTISLEIGINIAGGDTMRERTFVSAFNGFLDTIRELRPNTPILVVSPIFCGPIEDHPGPLLWGYGGPVRTIDRPSELGAGALTLRRTRELLAAHVRNRQERGDVHLHYLDGLALFGAADAHDLPDALHPNTAGYSRIADRFLAAVSRPGGIFDHG
jgi:hypothetical protein